MVVWLLLEWLSPSQAPTRSVEFPRESVWMTVADELQPTGCYRFDFELSRSVKHAWVQVAAEGGFELICNGNAVGGFTHWRPTRPFQNGLTESGQRLHHSPPAMGLNFAREYQWTGHANERIPVFFDLRPHLKEGRNSICLSTEARKPQQGVRLYGNIQLDRGEDVALYSGAQWKAEAIPVGHDQRSWVNPKASVASWRQAVPLKRDSHNAVSLIPLGCFESPFETRWLTVKKQKSGDLVYRRKWNVKSPVADSYLRIVANTEFVVRLNGVILPSLKGEQEPFWNVDWSGRRPLGTAPALLDPDEVVRYFGGSDFLNPRHGDPTENDFQRTELQINQTTDRPDGVDGFQVDGEEEEKGRVSELGPVIQEPSMRVPKVLARSLSVERMRLYGVEHVLKSGDNVLEVRMHEGGNHGYQRSRTPRLAYDIGSAGKTLISSATSDAPARENILQEVVTRSQFPPMVFVGNVLPSRVHKWWALAVGLFGILFFYNKSPRVSTGIILFSVSLALFFLLRVAFYERSELLWFRSPLWPVWVLVSSAVIGLLGSLLSSFRNGKKRGFQIWMLFVVLALAVFVRAWQIDFQAIDDDEYATIQAAISIAEKGVPEIAPGIYYTRSPFYHYVAGAVAWLFGPHLFALRLLSVLAAAVTAWFVWLLAKLILKKDGLALITVVFFSLHPFLIFSGHLARFYQFQQLFVVLTIWLFFVGFLEGRDVRWKVAAIVSFGLAIFSQEISIVLVVPLAVVWLLAGSSFVLKRDWCSVVAVALLGVLVVLDFLTFKVLCITRPVGVSPNVEATVAPGFWEVSNFFAMFTANARLHVLLSGFVLLSLVSAVWRKERLVLSLHGILFFGIIAVNLLISSVSFRYQYTLIPFWMILGVHGLGSMASWMAFVTTQPKVRGALLVLLSCAVIASWSPWRIIGSYNVKLLGDSITALRYVKSEWREGDKVMITEPHPHAAKMELGQVDYDLSIPILYDFAYNDNGLLRDRNGNAEVVNRLARLQEIVAKEDRLWVVVNREKFRSRKRNIRWEYPGARVELFLRKNCELAHRSYLWDVYLWDRSKGKFFTFRKESNLWVE